ncbi:hypothetical protein VPH35_089000 [Triticum aestivum]
MFIVEDKGSAIALMCAALLFLGTWPALLTLLERRGRLPQHTYLDYSITNLLAAVLIALTLGQLGESKQNMPNFFTQLTQDNWPSVLFAMAGGLVLSIGNLSTQYAWAYVGLSVTEVICASMVVVIGNGISGSRRVADILFTGVACFLVAVILGTAVHASNAADNEEKLIVDIENGASAEDATRAEAGTAKYLIELEGRRSIKVFGSSKLKGLGLVFFAGVCLALFSPALNLATNDQWHILKDRVQHLVVYTAFFYFSISCLSLSSFKAYLNDWEGRQWALLAGLLCGLGNGFQFMGGQAAGYAAADAVEALPLVSTFWGIVLFGEYRKSSKKTYTLLVFMLLMFIAAVATLMASAGHRSTK